MMSRCWHALSGLDRFLAALLLAMAVLAALAIFTSLQLQKDQRKIIEISSYNLPFSYSRSQVEILNLKDSIQDVLLGRAPLLSPALRLAIVENRASAIPLGVEGLEMPEAVVARWELVEAIRRVEPLIATLDEPGHGDEALAHLQDSVRSFTQLGSLASMRQSEMAETEQTLLSNSIAWLFVNLLLLCFIGVALVALILRQKRNLERMAVTDGLTSLLNRAGLQAWATPDRRPVPIAVAVLDVDHFKTINDSLGHARGDDVIRLLARCIRDHIEEGSVAARLGGDEFVILFFGREPVLAARRDCGALARTFRRAAAAQNLTQVSVSIGIATGRAGSSTDLAPLMLKADNAMYAAKQAGGDRLHETVSFDHDRAALDASNFGQSTASSLASI